MTKPAGKDHMREQDGFPALPLDALQPPSVEENHDAQWRRAVGRRSFLKRAGIAGAMALPGSALFASQASANASSAITDGDVAILRMLAAAELIEADLWQQYDELGGVNGGNPAYMAALTNIDGDMPTYVHLNNNDEQSHAAFLNAYLKSKGAEPVNLDAFRTLPSSKATGAKQIGRLTSLTSLDVDTSWYTRYRSSTQPRLRGEFPAGVHDPQPAGDPDQRRRHAAEYGRSAATHHAGAEPHAGDRLHRGVPLRLHRAGRIEPVLDPGRKGDQPRGASDRVEHRRQPRPCTSPPGRTTPATPPTPRSPPSPTR